MLKKYILPISIVLIYFGTPINLCAQTLTGLWSGTLSNDSSSIRKDQSFEIALTEYKGKVYGYSCNEFIVNDTLYYIVKRVKGIIIEDECKVTDEEIVAYNFRGKLEKGVKVTSTFKRNKEDSTWYLDGTWKTNATKKYYSVSGKVSLSEEKDFSLSKVFPHLEELNLADQVAFYRERKQEDLAKKLIKPHVEKTKYDDKKDLTAVVVIQPYKPELQKSEADKSIVGAIQADAIVAAIQKPENDLDKNYTNTNINGNDTKTVLINKPALPIEQKKISITENPTTKTPITNHTNKPKQEVTAPIKTSAPTIVATQPKNKPSVATVDLSKQTNNNTTPTNTKPTEQIKETAKATITKAEPVAPKVIKSDNEIAATGVVIENRKTDFSKVVHFKTDSLVLALYDNGEIDGDTVSVYLNGEPLMIHQGLKAAAIKKTIYIDKSKEDFNLVLFADNLGKYPPNTGLLVVRDGDEVYNILFRSDLTKSSGIIFRKKQ